MKSGNYYELMDKFYAGTANAEEISLLRTEGLIDEQDNLYAETLKSERGQKINWEFEDFMKEIPAAKVVALPSGRRWLKRIMTAAAMVAAILIAYIFWPQHHQPKEIVNVPVINKPINNNSALNVRPALPLTEGKDSVVLTEMVKTMSKRNKEYAAKKNKQIQAKNIKHIENQNVEMKSGTRNFLVLVNGKPITNEEDAITVTRESLALVSRNLTSTVDELKPLSRIKIKLSY